MDKELQEKARKKRNKYMREWRRKNKDKVKQYNQNYWINKAKQEERKKEQSNKQLEYGSITECDKEEVTNE